MLDIFLHRQIFISWSRDPIFVGVGKYPTLYVSSSWFQQHWNWQLQTINISDIYVRIMFICHNFIDSSICGSNWQHSMLYFHKENKILQKKNAKEYCQKLC